MKQKRKYNNNSEIINISRQKSNAIQFEKESRKGKNIKKAIKERQKERNNNNNNNNSNSIVV